MQYKLAKPVVFCQYHSDEEEPVVKHLNISTVITGHRGIFMQGKQGRCTPTHWVLSRPTQWQTSEIPVHYSLPVKMFFRHPMVIDIYTMEGRIRKLALGRIETKIPGNQR